VGVYVIGLLAALTPVRSTFSPSHIREIKEGIQDVQPKREISSIVTVQGVNGLGLLITAVIQTILGKLSLYHAFLVINLLFLLSTSFLYFFFNRTSHISYLNPYLTNGSQRTLPVPFPFVVGGSISSP
jgi:hypothetical protein